MASISYKHFLRKLGQPIRLAGEYVPTYLVPTAHIKQLYGYKNMRKSMTIKYPKHDNYDKEAVNHFVRLIRKGQHHEIQPIMIAHSPKADEIVNPFAHAYGLPKADTQQPKHKYTLLDGHHRLTAHKITGKKYIKAIFVGPNMKNLNDENS